LHQLSLVAALLVFAPATVALLLYLIYYIGGGKYSELKPKSTRLNGVVSVLIPVKNEPLEYIDEALKQVYEWGLKDLVEVIVVTDDDHKTYEKIEEIARQWRERGLEVLVLRRSTPRGFKAGALNTALWFSRGKYVCVLDVDCRVSRDFILTACSIIRENTDVVAVTGRWFGENRDSRVAEAAAYSMDFTVDLLYRGRSGLNLPVFPLGAGTVYDARFLKTVLKGWDEDCYLAEDLEIGCRVFGLGKRVVFLDSYRSILEVPRKYSSFRVQQERWASGSLSVLISRFKYISSAPRPWYVKLELSLYLLQYFPVVSTFIGTLLLAPLALLYGDVLKRFLYLPALWGFLALTHGALYVESLRKRGLSFWRSIVNLGRSSALSVSLAPVFTKAYLKTLMGVRGGFKRTPKGVYEALKGGLRFPVEAFIGVLFFMLAVYLWVFERVFTSLWVLTYSLSYLYATVRWWREIVFKPR